MAIHYTDPEQLHGAQADILWEMLTLNPKLIRRTAISVNQQLNTKNARIISAINEVKALADQAIASIEGALNHVNGVVGNVGDDATKAKLDEMGGTVIDAAYGLRQQVSGLLDEAKQYTDEKLANIEIIDGGLF